MEEINEPVDQTVYLGFYMAGEEYAIPIPRVKEVVECGHITRLPTMPPCMRGLMNLRGIVVPVVDLAVKFSLAETALTRWACIVLVEVDLEGEPTMMGIIVDAVSQVIEIADREIEPPPAFGTRIRVDYLLGMGKLDNRFVLILDVDRVLSIDELLTVCSLQTEEASLSTPAMPAY